MAMTLELSDQPMHPIFIPWCAGASRHERLVQKHVPDSDPGWMVPVTTVRFVMPASVGIPSHSSFPRKRESRGGVGCGNETRTLPPTNVSNFHTLVCRHQPA